jgi:hypothetical protein
MTSAAALVSVERREEVRLPRFAGNQGPQDDPEDSLQGDCVVPPPPMAICETGGVPAARRFSPARTRSPTSAATCSR